MPRLFTALEVPEDVARELEMMRGGVDGARWIDRENYHITLRFIGDVGDDVADELGALLDELPVEPFAIRLSGLGAFGGRKPRNLWVGVEECAELNALQAAHERACRRVGLPPETRKFTPHVTLARLRNGASEPVQSFIARNNLYRSRLIAIERFVLMSSRPSRGGGPYAVEGFYPDSLSI